MDKQKLKIIICAIIGAAVTWYLNNSMGYGLIVANGLVGVVGAIVLPAPLASALYTASFVGMSGTKVLPTIYSAALGGLLAGIVISYSSEVYAGIGGKGGTTAALSVQVTRGIIHLFG